MISDWAQNTTALKWLVGVMTTLLVVGLIALFVGLARTSSELTAASAAKARAFGDIEVELPRDARVLDAGVSGDRLTVRLIDAAGGERVVVFDLTTGARLGAVRLAPAP